MTGSAARRSARTKPAAQTTASTPSRMIGKEPQAYVLPPSEVSSTRQTADAPISAVPA